MRDIQSKKKTTTDKRIKILGLPIDLICMEEILDNIKKALIKKEKKVIIAINPKKIILSLNDKELAKIINEASILLPDSAHLSRKILCRVTGIDLMQNICAKIEEAKIYMYGSSEESVTKAKKNLETTYSNIKIVGYKNGYSDENEVIQDINNSKANILFVALGSPKQEKWIYKNKENLKANVIMGVGGSFDVISGKFKRAPQCIRKIGLEWLYRMIIEPKRLKDVPKYIKYMYLIRKERWKNKWKK